MNMLLARIPSLVWCDHEINEFNLPDVYPVYNYAIRSRNCRLVIDIRQNSSFIYLSHDHTTQEKKKWNSCRQYRMNSQQYCSLGSLNWARQESGYGRLLLPNLQSWYIVGLAHSGSSPFNYLPCTFISSTLFAHFLACHSYIFFHFLMFYFLVSVLIFLCQTIHGFIGCF